MDTLPLTLVALGGLLLAGMAAEWLGRRAHVPGVTMLVLLGLAAGPSGLDLLPDHHGTWMPLLSTVALTMIGFLLGHEFTLDNLRRRGRSVLAISIGVTAITALVVAGGLAVLGLALAPALLLGAVATATDPAAVVAVVNDAKAEGPFTGVLLGVVAIDDVWGILMFSVTMSAVTLFAGGGDVLSSLWVGAWESVGGIGLGCVLGVPMALLSGRLSRGEPTRLEALGFVLLCGGLARYLDVSYLLAAVAMGTVVANLGTHHERPFDAIEDLDRPFLVVFFVLAGASLELERLLVVGWGVAGFVVLRVLGRLVGAWIGGRAGRTPPAMERYMGLALLPQAGVALGLALLVGDRFPEAAEIVLPVVVASTVIFELVGPLATRWALGWAGEAGEA